MANCSSSDHLGENVAGRLSCCGAKARTSWKRHNGVVVHVSEPSPLESTPTGRYERGVCLSLGLHDTFHQLTTSLCEMHF